MVSRTEMQMKGRFNALGVGAGGARMPVEVHALPEVYFIRLLSLNLDIVFILFIGPSGVV